MYRAGQLRTIFITILFGFRPSKSSKPQLFFHSSNTAYLKWNVQFIVMYCTFIYSISLGGARYQKLGATARGKISQGTARAIHFCVGARVDHLFSCCVHQKDVAGSRSRTPVRGSEGRSSPEVETLLAVGGSMKAVNLPALLIFANAEKNRKYLCCLAKMTFNKSHFSMCMVTECTLSLSKFFLGEKLGGGKGEAAAPHFCPLPLWRRPCL